MICTNQGRSSAVLEGEETKMRGWTDSPCYVVHKETRYCVCNIKVTVHIFIPNKM